VIEIHGVAEQADEADEAFGGTVARMEVPPHARAGQDGRGHRFAAYARCSTDYGGAMRAWAAIIGIAVLLSGCAGPRYRERVLPSGRVVKVMGLGRVYLTDGGRWAIVLKYETNVPMEDLAALRTEAMDIWTVFRTDADASGLSVAALSANEPPRYTILGPFVTTNRSHGFAFEKRDGTWVPMPDKSASPEDHKGN
jgi:hypothetical protein